MKTVALVLLGFALILGLVGTALGFTSELIHLFRVLQAMQY